MNIKEHTTPERLERYAFFWSLARLVIAAFSLFFGAMPIVYTLAGFGGSAVFSLLPLFWLISGAASLYLLYRWYMAGMMVFGGKDTKDMVIFLIMAVSGVNLGYAAIGGNVGMSLVWGMPIGALIFKVTAVVYLIVAYMMMKRWKESGETLFPGAASASHEAPTVAEQQPQTASPAEGTAMKSDENSSSVPPRPSI
jgi:hypothetical protein